MKAITKFCQKVTALGDAPTELHLVQVNAKGQRSHVDTIELGDDPLPYQVEDRMAELVASIVETATADAEGWGTACRYILTCEAGHRQLRSAPFKVTPENCDDAELAEDEVSEAAVVGMLMRHVETKERNLNNLVQATFGPLTETVMRLTEENQRNEKLRFKQFELVEELLSKKHERELEAQREEVKAQAVKRLVNGIAPHVPLLAGKILTGKVAPQNVADSPQMKAIAEIIEGLSDPELAKLQDVLGAERSAAMIEVMMQIKAAQLAAESESEDGDGHRDDGGSAGGNGHPGNGSAAWH